MTSGDDPTLDLHRTLGRQLRRLQLSQSTPPSAQEWRTLLDDISAVYTDADRDRELLERAVEISSREMQTLNQRLAEQASTDALTGLFNRAALMEELDLAIATGPADDGTVVGVLFIDLDGFKFINDQLGHAAGDNLLCCVAERLQECVREGNVVARHGGDEFVIVAMGLKNVQQADALAGRIIAKLSESIPLPGHRPARVGASIGVVILDGDPNVTAEQILADADTAMYSAKTNGRNQVVVFNGSAHEPHQLKDPTSQSQRLG